MQFLFLKNKVTKKTFLGLIFVILFAASLFAPLFIGKIFFDGDTLTYDYPAFSFYSEAIKAHESTALNPYYLGGFPMAISPVGSFIDPLNRLLLTVLSDFFIAYHVRFFISIALALFFSYLFGRKVGLSALSAVILSFLYLLGQTFNNLTSGLINSGSVFLLPALLLIVQLLHETTTRKKYVAILCAGAVLLCFGFVSGFIQTIFYTLFFVGAYALFLGWKKEGSIFSVRRWKGLIGYVLVGILAIIPAYLVMKGTFDFRSLTLRTEGFAAADITGLSPVDFFYFFMPDHVMLPLLSSGQALGLFIGIPALFFALVSLFYLRKENTFASFSAWAYGITILSLLTPLGIPWLMAHLPVFSWFHSIKRLLLPAVFFCAYLAAYGFERVSHDPEFLGKRKFFLKGFMIISALPFLLLLVITSVHFFVPLQDSLFQEALAQKLYLLKGGTIAQFSTEKSHYISVFSSAIQTLLNTFSLSNIPLALLFFLAPLSAILTFLYTTHRLVRKWFIRGVSIILLGTVWLSFAGTFINYPSRASFLKTPVLASVLTNKTAEDGEYAMSFLTGEGIFRNLKTDSFSPDERMQSLVDLLRPNFNILHKVKRLDGYEPYQTARSAHLLNEVIAGEKITIKGFSSFEKALEEKQKDFLSKLPLLSAYGVGYIITPYPLTHTTLTLATTTYVATMPLYTYHNTQAFSPVFIPHLIHIKNTWQNESFNFIGEKEPTESVIECLSCAEEDVINTGTVKIVSDIPGELALSVLAPNEGTWVIINRANLPKWRVFVDTTEAKLTYANYIMQAVFVPAGEHTVIFLYR